MEKRHSFIAATFVFFVFVLFSSASIAGEKLTWETLDLGQQIPTFCWDDASVHSEPDEASQTIGTLPKSPPNVEDVIIERVRVLYADGEEIRDAWWYITSPLKGWVKGESLGLWNSGFLSGD